MAFSVAYLAVVDFVPSFGFPVYPVGYLPIFAFIFLAALAIWRYNLTDVTPALTLKRVIENMSDALLITDLDGTIRIASKSSCVLLNEKEQKLIGLSIADRWPGVPFVEQSETLAAAGKLTNIELDLHHPDERWRLLSVSATVMRDSRDEPVGAVYIATDITDRREVMQRKKAERALAKRTTALERR